MKELPAIELLLLGARVMATQLFVTGLVAVLCGYSDADSLK